MTFSSRVRAISLNTSGLTDKCRPALVRFGKRDTGLVMRVHDINTMDDPASKLLVFPLDDVFTHPTAFIGFGTPNTYMVVPDANGESYKFAAFMFWRQQALVVRTKGRVQAGVLFEFVDLPQSKLDDLRTSMDNLAGTRSVSCAHLNATALADAGFSFGDGHSLRTIKRPSKFASLLWRRGLAYVNEVGERVPVQLRVIQATPRGFSDHFVGVWMREADSLKRTVQKQYAKSVSHTPAPTFEPQALPELRADRWTGPVVTVGMAKSSTIGANFAFLVGQKPTYTVKLPDLQQVAELRQPLSPFPVIEDKVTWLKRHVLFSKPVIRMINRARVAGIDWYTNGLKAGTVIDMLAPSDGPEYEQATLYNCVVVADEMRITGLHTREERNMQSKLIRIIDWIAAKHVLLSDYDNSLVFACELWTYRDENGQPVVCFNPNSGTYRPDEKRMEAFASYLRDTFGVSVQTFTH